MAIKRIRPTTAGRRQAEFLNFDRITASTPHKPLTKTKKKITGRNSAGKITIRHRGGAQKRKLRLIDFKRNKRDIMGKVLTIEYDPNRTANIALISYPDGEKRYILAPDTLHVGDTIIAADTADIEPGNALPLKNIPIGTPIHNLEIDPNKGAKLVRGAGTAAFIQSKESKFANVLLPSKEIRLISLDSYATIGQVSNQEWKEVRLGKAGKSRHRGRRPEVRGVAMHPDAHPHGGGEGRSGIGMKAPKTPWGKKALGLKTRNKRRYSTKHIVKDRRVKK
jgi:large subunit ribosomal protein L2